MVGSTMPTMAPAMLWPNARSLPSVAAPAPDGLTTNLPGCTTWRVSTARP